jgi:hypothetical protein
MVPALLSPCRAPFESAAALGWAPGIPRVAGGILYTIQCVNVPAGASGSSSIRTRLCVPAGTFCHETSGDSDAPLQVQESGRTDPGTRESTASVNGPDETGTCVCGVDDRATAVGTGAGLAPGGAVVVHPHTRTTMMSGAINRENHCLCITGHAYPG